MPTNNPTQPDTNHTDKIDELICELMDYSFDYGAGKIPSSENPPLLVARKIKAQLRAYISEEIKAVIGKDDKFTEFDPLPKINRNKLRDEQRKLARNRGHNV